MPSPSFDNVVIARVAGALYGYQLGKATMDSVLDAVAQNGINAILNAVVTRDFGSSTSAAVANTLVTNLGITGADQIAEANAIVVAALNAAGAPNWGSTIANLVNNFANLTTNAFYGTFATNFNNAVSAAVTLSQTTGSTDVNSFTPTSEFTGKTFTLTTGIDSGSAFVGAAGIDTFNATGTTFTALDSIDGGAGNDVLNISDVNATGGQAYAVPTSAAVVNIETVNITVASDNVADALTADLSAYTGLKTVNAVINGTDAPITLITTKGNATAATLTGSTTAAITDSATTDTLATVTAASATGLVTVTSSALTTLNLTSSSGGATVTAAAGTRALTVNLNGNTGGTITDATATSVAVSNTTTASSATTLSAAAATAVTLAATGKALTLAALTTGAAKTVGVSGDAAVTVTAHTLDAAAVITSTNTKGVTFTAALAAGQQFVGAAGNDSIKISDATTVAQTLGDGSNTLNLNAGFAAFGTGGSAAGGAGTDTLKGDAADLVTLSGATTFEGKISSFERLSVNALGANSTINLANLDDINYVTSAGGAFTLTLNNTTTGATLVQTASATGNTIGSTAAYTSGTADSFNWVGQAAATTAFGTLALPAVETVNLTSTDTNDAPAGTVQHTLTVTAASATTVVVTGNAGLDLTAADTTITSFDASAMTVAAQDAGADGAGVKWTSGALAAAATVKGTDGVDTIDLSAALEAVTITGGAGGKAAATGDTLKGGAGADTITSTGLGNATLVGGAGNDTITGGSGDDNITGGTGKDTLTGGAGKDTFTYTAANQSQGVTVDTITDFAAGTSTSVIDKIAVDVAGTGVYRGEASGYGAVLTSLVAGVNGQAVLDTSTSTLYIDVDGNGTLDTLDMAIQLTGVTDLHTGNFVFS